jgi:formylglycine-generating enzyme required for sulfatase activity
VTTGPSSASPAVVSEAPSVAPTLAATPVPSDGQTAGQARTDTFGIEQVWVPAGTFTMGTDAKAIAALEAQSPPDWVTPEFPSEQPAHEVTLTTGYWIDKDEVTNAAFAAFVDAGGYTNQALWSPDGWTWLGGKDAAHLPLHCQGDVPEHPRMCLTWYEAEAYAAWRGGRLPTEAEWEYAARGPESKVYPWGDTFDRDRANVLNSVSPKPVGSYPTGTSWVGANDMAGNAMEWVSDWLGVDYYATSPATDPTGPATGEVKVEKGGWWGSNEFVARSAYRHYEDPPTYGDKHIGFRVASQ